MTVSEALKRYQQIGGDSPRLDVEVLLANTLNKSRTWLYTWPETRLSGEQNKTFLAALERRRQGEPVAYIVGHKEFWSLPLKVNSSTLIPRDDTETLVEAALNYIASKKLQAPSILDLGCGCGAVTLALASELSQAQVLGVDRIKNAVDLAIENRDSLGLKNVIFFESNWFSEVDPGRTFDVVVSNPPYIDADDQHLALGDVRYEPQSALVAGQNGLADICAIARQAKGFLRPSGWLALEHGWQQAHAVRQQLEREGYGDVRTIKDLSGCDRVTCGLAPS